MLEKGKISALQMGIMMYPTIMATAILFVPAITMEHAKRDMWMSPIWASLVGFLTVYIAFQLNNLYPKQTIIQYTAHILGVIPGKAIGFIFLFFYLHVTGAILREYTEFVVSAFLSRTPMIVVLGSMTLACAFAVRAGVEVLGRLAEMIVPILILLLLSVILLLLPDFRTKHMFPIMENGIMPSIRGALTPQAWFTEFILMSFLLPFLTDREKGMKWGMISVFGVMLTLFLTNITVLLVFGGGAARMVYPVMAATRYISIADFLEHLETIVMAIWVAGAFVKICVFYYSLALGTAQWLNLSNYRPVVFPLGILLVQFAIWTASNESELAYFLATSGSLYLTAVQLVIPLFVLLVAYIRKRDGNNKEEHRR
ncbi:GerAB/ArcD/ProY family transporter [Effusibacillus consociatus]|uniref:Endospore germination permease n=1 Tax=Effusibacillus consociatus TaxID=1117041 RepID=A0ABV9Q5M4_9BACL